MELKIKGVKIKYIKETNPNPLSFSIARKPPQNHYALVECSVQMWRKDCTRKKITLKFKTLWIDPEDLFGTPQI